MIRFMMTAAVALGLSGAALAQDAEPAQKPVVIEMSEGNLDAPVEVIEYASFTCGHCATFNRDQYAKLRENYIDTDKIKFTFRDVYFDRPGLWASMVARCGGEMRFFGMSDLLFEKQRDWIGDGDMAGIVERLRTVGKSGGLSDEQLDACLSDADKALALVEWHEANTEEHNIKATPSLVINGETHSNMSYEDLAALIDAELAKSAE